MKEVKIGLMQLEASSSLEESLRKLHALSKRLEEPNIVIIPEYSMLDPTEIPTEILLRVSESLESPGRWLRALMDLAKTKETCVIGTLFRREGKSSRVRNSVVLIDSNGDIVSYYDKTHLFDALGLKESEKFEPGNRLFDPIDLCGTKIGVSVCFELRFPEIFRYETLRGAEVIAVPAAWYRGPLKEEMLDFLTKTRAHENTVFIALAGLSGERFVGGSRIVDPLGFNLISLGPVPNHYLEASIEVERRIREVRDVLPVLKLMRRDLYHLPLPS